MKQLIKVIEADPEIRSIAKEVANDFYKSAARKGYEDDNSVKAPDNLLKFKSAIERLSLDTGHLQITDREIVRLCIEVERRASIMS